jgi:RNA polymerase sigma factor (sigma-70 family)
MATRSRSLNRVSGARGAESPPALTTRKSLPEPSSAQLRALAGREGRAWQALWDDFRAFASALCERRQVPQQDVDDILIEAFLSLWRAVNRFRPNGHEGEFTQWFKKITYSRVNDYFRKEARHPHGRGGDSRKTPLAHACYQTSTDDEQAQDGPAAADVLAPLLEAVCRHFSQRVWTAFLQTRLGERPVSEVAAELCMTPAAVSMGNLRILARLQREFGAKLSAGGENEQK